MGQATKQFVRGPGGGVKRVNSVRMATGRQDWACGEVGGRGEVLNVIDKYHSHNS